MTLSNFKHTSRGRSNIPTEASYNAMLELDLLQIIQNCQSEFEQLANSSLLLTGGAGFLGYYLCLSIVKWNKISLNKTIKLSILDNFARGKPAWLEKLTKENELTLIEADLSMPIDNKLENFNYIIHAASIASPTIYRQYPLLTMDVNINGLRLLLEHTRAKPVKSILFFSSSEIYGDPPLSAIPTPESFRGNVSCTGPRACYDEAKRYGETLCVTFNQKFETPVKIVRPFNNYGPGLNIKDTRVIPDFAKNILNNEDIILHSDGKPTRTFCYITDAITGYFKALIHGRDAEPYNIGNQEPEISIKDLAQLFMKTANKMIGYDKCLSFKKSIDQSYLVDNPARRVPDITKAKNDLGFEPIVKLETGLQNSLLWYLFNQ